MFRNLLKPDSGLMVTMTWLTDGIFLSLFWILGCVPVVTIGTSCAALYDAAFRGFRLGDKHSWQRFWQVFRENWKAGILPTVIFLALFFLLGKAMILVWNAAATGAISWMLFSAAAFLGVTALGILSLMFPVLSRFENSLGGLLKNTLLLAPGQPAPNHRIGHCHRRRHTPVPPVRVPAVLPARSGGIDRQPAGGAHVQALPAERRAVGDGLWASRWLDVHRSTGASRTPPPTGLVTSPTAAPVPPAFRQGSCGPGWSGA